MIIVLFDNLFISSIIFNIEINDTSQVTISKFSSDLKFLISVFSKKDILFSFLIFSWSWFEPTSTQVTFFALLSSNICVKPPVLLPISKVLVFSTFTCGISSKKYFNLYAARLTRAQF